MENKEALKTRALVSLEKQKQNKSHFIQVLTQYCLTQFKKVWNKLLTTWGSKSQYLTTAYGNYNRQMLLCRFVARGIIFT